MNNLFASRMAVTRKSFVREILKVTERPEIISFAGGLPNPRAFPVDKIAEVTGRLLKDSGPGVLQYSTTEGYLPLREYIAARYREKKGLKISPDDILITNGSQQGLDLAGKALLNRGDTVVMEKPGYLGAIQAFSIFEPSFRQVPLDDGGIDAALLDRELARGAKIFYAVTNFQNPSGISYSADRRADVAAILKKHSAIFIEDDPYGELRFEGEDLPYVRNFIDERAILLGTFSKIVAPGLRLGWICAPREIMEKLVVAKQAADLHSNILSQRIVYAFLTAHSLDSYVGTIRALYKKHRDLMLESMARHFPPEVKVTRPQGGMFLWVTMPEGYSSLDLFQLAIRENVAFVPDEAFYADGVPGSSFRMNFSNADPDKIEEGVRRLAAAMKGMMGK